MVVPLRRLAAWSCQATQAAAPVTAQENVVVAATRTMPARWPEVMWDQGSCGEVDQTAGVGVGEDEEEEHEPDDDGLERSATESQSQDGDTGEESDHAVIPRQSLSASCNFAFSCPSFASSSLAWVTSRSDS